MRKIIMLALLGAITGFPEGSAQELFGRWKGHLPWIQARRITEANDRIFVATETGIFYYLYQDQSVHTITRVDGLSDLDITAVSFTSYGNVLVVAYNNGNLDLVRGGEITNIPDIKRKQLTGNKTINDILVVENLAYLACGFGIVVVNLDRDEIKDTYYIGEEGGQVNVMSMAYDGRYLYAATSTGIYQADSREPNLIDFNNWNRLEDIPNSSGAFNSIVYFDDRLFVNFSNQKSNSDTIYCQEDGQWIRMPGQRYFRVYRMRVSRNALVVNYIYRTDTYNKDYHRLRVFETLTPRDALVDRDFGLWVADVTQGTLVKYRDREAFSVIPNGPKSKDVVDMAMHSGKLYTAAGGVGVAWDNLYRSAELNWMEDDFWGEGYSSKDYRDLVSLAVDPSDQGHVFAGSWGYGLLEFKDGELVEVYRDHNSTLQTIEPGNFFRLGGLCFDHQNNLWVGNSNVPEAISVRKADGSWKSFSFGGMIKDAPAISDMICTGNGHIWGLLPKNYGLFAFDVNRTIDDESDDRYLQFDIRDGNNTLISNNVFSLAEDLDGNIWVGTDKGVVVYYSPARVLSGDAFNGQQIIVPRNDGTGLADILLGTETVTAIAVDGANRKWVGTAKSGVFLLSEDGLEQVHNFTTDNSPLLSNRINDIVIEGSTGTVYFGTGGGVVSYRSDAVSGLPDFQDVYVYPNPVREDYDGEIVITGMIRDAIIKITDISGNLVYELQSQGGQAIWDGRSFSGKRVSTGVYLVFCSNEDGTLTHITKLLVIN